MYLPPALLRCCALARRACSPSGWDLAQRSLRKHDLYFMIFFTYPLAQHRAWRFFLRFLLHMYSYPSTLAVEVQVPSLPARPCLLARRRRLNEIHYFDTRRQAWNANEGGAASRCRSDQSAHISVLFLLMRPPPCTFVLTMICPQTHLSGNSTGSSIGFCSARPRPAAMVLQLVEYILWQLFQHQVPSRGSPSSNGM